MHRPQFPSRQSSTVWNMISITYSRTSLRLSRDRSVSIPLIGPMSKRRSNGMRIPHPQEQTRSSPIHNPKLYLRPSASVSGRLTWTGQANLLADQHSTPLGQAALRPMRRKLDAASKAHRITMAIPVRSSPAYAAYDRRRVRIASIDQREWLGGLRLREFYEGGRVIEQLQMIEAA